MQEYWNQQPGVRVEDHGWGVKCHVADGLFNPVSTQRIYMREKPWHRVCAELAASGHTVMEIVAFTRRSRRAVQQVLAQPYAQARIAAKSAMNASDEIREILEDVAPASLKRIAKLAVTASESADQSMRELGMKADQAILDRFLGKPNQPITTISPAAKPDKELTDEELDHRCKDILTRLPAPEPGGHSESNGESDTTEYT